MNTYHLPLFKMAAPQPNTYTFKPGDSVAKVLPQLQKQNPGLTMNSLMSYNGLTDQSARRLPVGYQMKVPAPTKPTFPEPVVGYQPQPASQMKQTAVDPFYRAISYAEHGNNINNPESTWIRTKAKPDPKLSAEERKKLSSTAYGPVQLTRRKALDYVTQNPKRFKSHMAFYNNVMAPQYAKFAYYGAEPNKLGYDAKWDYGGRGNELNPQQRDQYAAFAQEIMNVDRDKVAQMQGLTSEQQIERRVQMWRGKPRSADPGYYNRFYHMYNQLTQK